MDHDPSNFEVVLGINFGTLHVILRDSLALGLASRPSRPGRGPAMPAQSGTQDIENGANSSPKADRNLAETSNVPKTHFCQLSASSGHPLEPPNGIQNEVLKLPDGKKEAMKHKVVPKRLKKAPKREHRSKTHFCRKRVLLLVVKMALKMKPWRHTYPMCQP